MGSHMTICLPLHLVDDVPAAKPVCLAPDVVDVGLTAPNGAARRYRHGTLSAYTADTCRCPHCRAAFAAYRAAGRADGYDSPRGKRQAPHPDSHISRGMWRTRIWYPACASANLDPRPRTHDLRHSHASWLLSGGADLEVVRDRLGHGSITTTGRYTHTLSTADDTALAALARIRYAVRSSAAFQIQDAAPKTSRTKSSPPA